MTKIDPKDLLPVLVICNTELEQRATDEFIKNYNMLGMKTILLECEVEDFDPSDDHNYVLADYGNVLLLEQMTEKFEDLGKRLKIIKFES